MKKQENALFSTNKATWYLHANNKQLPHQCYYGYNHIKISKPLSLCKKKIANLLCVLYIHFCYYEHNHSSKNK